MKRAALGSFVAGLGIFLALGVASPAAAHTEFTSSTPADGAALAAAPARVDLVFSEAPLADAIDVAITDSTGAVVGSPTTTVDGSTVVVPWPADLPDGAYSVNFRVVSDDGHPVEGTVAFTYGTAASASTSSTTGPLPVEVGSSSVLLLVVGLAAVGVVVVAIALIVRRGRGDRP